MPLNHDVTIEEDQIGLKGVSVHAAALLPILVLADGGAVRNGLLGSVRVESCFLVQAGEYVLLNTQAVHAATAFGIRTMDERVIRITVFKADTMGLENLSHIEIGQSPRDS